MVRGDSVEDRCQFVKKLLRRSFAFSIPFLANSTFVQILQQ